MLMVRESKIILVAVLIILSWSAVGRAGTPEDDGYLAAIRQFNQHNWDQAQQSLRDFQTRFPNSRWRWAVKLRLADLETDPERAENLYREVIAQKESREWSWDARWGLAAALYSRGRYPQAREIFLGLAQSHDVRRILSLYYAGLCALALNQTDAALEAFSEITDHHPQAEIAGASLIALGDVELAAHHAENARIWYQQYLKEKPEGELAAQAQAKLQSLEDVGNTREALSNQLKPASIEGKQKFAPPVFKAAVPSATPTSEVPAKGRTFCVQVGAFSKIEYAQGMVRKLQNLGLKAFMQESKSGKEKLHLVRVGNFATRAEAERQASQLNQNEAMPTLVVSVPANTHPAIPIPKVLRKKP
jgi:cell division septation protein DedD